MSSTSCSGLEVNHDVYRTDGKKLTWLRVMCMHPVRRTHNNVKKRKKKKERMKERKNRIR